MSTPRTCGSCRFVLSDDAVVVCPSCGNPLPTGDTRERTDRTSDADTRTAGPPSLGTAPQYDDLPTTDSRAAAARTHSHLPPPEDREPGTPVVPGYEVYKLLGRGAMGEVYRARGTIADRAVAVKVIRGDPDQYTPKMVARFVREARTMSAIRHPNVVQVFHADAPDGRPYLVMEYVDGPTLSRRLKAGRPDPATAAGWVAQLADGVAAAHTAGVVHRDIKPSNTLMADGDVVKVADFGLAAFADAGTLTRGGVGTAAYMAPEQWDARTQPAPAQDVWSLGVVLYECLVGRRPFDAEEVRDVYAQVHGPTPAAPAAVDPAVPAGLSAIAIKCLEKDPALRYPTAAGLAADLRAWRADAATAAERDAPARGRRNWVRRHRRAVGLAAAVLLLAAGGVASYEVRPVRQMGRELARGRPVTLIPMAGPPRWHDWFAGEVKTPGSVTGDGTFGFQTLDTSMIDLYPTPPAGGYTFAIDVRHEGGLGNDDSDVGVYVRFPDGPNPAVRRAVVFRYSDLKRADPPGVAATRGVEAVDFIFRQRAELEVTQNRFPTFFAVPPADAAANPWRRLVLRVSADGVRAWWNPPTDNPAGKPNLSAKRTDAGRMATMVRLPDGLTAPTWGAGGAVGGYAHVAAVAFRNAVLIPDPNP